jgi:hypothetical protein
LRENGASYNVTIEFYEPNDENKSETARVLEAMKQRDETADVISIPDTIYSIVADKGLLSPLDEYLLDRQSLMR